MPRGIFNLVSLPVVIRENAAAHPAGDVKEDGLAARKAGLHPQRER